MASMQGWRVDMEDAHVVEVSMADREPYKDWSFFAVFDGHAGNVAADDAAENIMKTLMETPQFEKVTEELKSNGGVLCEKSIILLEDGIKAGFLKLDENIRTRLDSDRSGSTAVCAMITPTHIIIANLGDSRAVVSRKDEGSFGTEDHKPYHDKERERIVGAGGSVMIQRINGSLAVSRALGDFEYKNVPGLEPNKQLVSPEPDVALGDFEYKNVPGLEPNKQLVSPEPDVYVLERQKDKDEFLVVACDGIYDVMENEELCRFVESRLHVCDDLNQVLDACLSKGSRDNMTMIVVCFEAAPSIDKEKVASEQIWKAQMLASINDVIAEETSKPGWSENDEMSIEFILRELAQRNLSSGGGPAHMLRSLADQVLTEKGIKHD
ncbi:protein phosphatase 2C [Ostertagia ostertagi]